MLIALLVVYNIYTGATIQEIGIPGLFSIKFGDGGGNASGGNGATDEFTFTFSPNPARRGEEVMIHMSEAKPVRVYYNGRALPKKTSHNERVITVTVPGDARNGYFELAWDGEHKVAERELIVVP